MGNELAKRKHPRLKDYDYSATGSYYVTICTQNRECLLSSILSEGQVFLTEYGKIAEEQLLALELRYPFVKVACYVIMPNHIHIVFVMDENIPDQGRPSLKAIVCAYKSLTTRECKRHRAIKKLFQTSYFEHIIRNEKDYKNTVSYICQNPLNWKKDDLYC